MSILTTTYKCVHLLWFCEEARQKILCFFFLSFPKFLSPVSPSLFFVSRSLVEKKRKKARIFVQRRVENIVKTRARVSLGAFQPLFCFRKEYFYAINDRNRYENVRAVSIQGQFARLIFPLLLKLILVVECPFTLRLNDRELEYSEKYERDFRPKETSVTRHGACLSASIVF